MKLETERLILRPIEEDDAPALFPLINDPDVAFNMLAVPHPYPSDALVTWITKAREAMSLGDRFELCIVLKETDLPIGVCSLCCISREHAKADVGYWIGKRHWGNGYVTEAVAALLRFGFEDLGLERIQADCFARNTASARVLEKAGLKYEGCGRREVRRGDEFLDVHHFGLVRADFVG